MSKHELAAIHGRFQPFHNGHHAYLLAALDRAETVIVGLTIPFFNPVPFEPTDDHRHLIVHNPFTYFERVDMIIRTVALTDETHLSRVRLVPFDLADNHWEEVVPRSAVQIVTVHDAWDSEKVRRFEAAGYTVEFTPPCTDRITASQVRTHLKEGDDSWRSLVPAGTAQVLDRVIDMTARLES